MVITASALVGGLSFLQSQTGNALIRSTVEARTPDFLPNVDLQVGDLETDLLTGIDIQDLRLQLKGTDTPAISIESFVVEWDIPRLFSNDILRGFVYISGVNIDIQEKDGVINLQTLFDTGQSSDPKEESVWPTFPLDVDLAIIDLNRSTIRWDDAELTAEIEAGLRLHKGDRVDLQLQQIQLNMPEVGGLDSRIAVSGNSQKMDVDIALRQENRGIHLQGVITDVIGEGNIDLASTIYCHQYCLEDITEQAIPQIDQEITLQLGGNISSIVADIALGEEDAFPIRAEVFPAEETWSASWRWNDFQLNDWIADLEPIILQGEYSLAGSGFSYAENMVVSIRGEAPEQEIWNERLQSLQLEANLDRGQLGLQNLKLSHGIGLIDLSGQFNLLESIGELSVGLDLDGLDYLSQFGLHNIRGHISGQPTLDVDWKEEPSVVLGGQIKVSALRTDVGRFQSLVSDMSGTINATSAVLQLKHRLRGVEATGIAIPDLQLDTDILAEFSGRTRVEGQIVAPEAVVEEGVVELHHLQGKFLTEVAEDISFETRDMRVGEVELVPIQYKIDGGPVALQFKENTVIADLHLLRKEKTFIDIQAKSELTSGTWWINRLTLSPTVGREWGLTEGMVFQLSDKGVQDFELALVSNAGAIRIFADTNNDTPDFSISVQDLQLPYALELAEIFGGVEGLPVDSTGLIHGVLHLRGDEARFGEQDFLTIQGLNLPELAENLDLMLDIGGELRRPKIRFVASSAQTKEELFRFDGYWPLNVDEGFSVNCDEYGHAQFFFSETNWLKWQRYFPQSPEVDAYLGLQFMLKGKACQPSMQLSGVTRLPLGTDKGMLRADWQAVFESGALDFSATIEEQLQPIFVSTGHVQTNLEAPIHQFLETMVWEEPEEMIEMGTVSIRPKDFQLARILPILDMDGVVAGEITGEIAFVGNLSSLEGGGELSLENGQIGSQTIDSVLFGVELDDSLAHVSLDSKIGEQGELAIRALLPFEEGENVDISGEIKDIPFSLVEAFVPELQNAEGRISSRRPLRVRGGRDELVVDLQIEGSDISFFHQDLGTKYQKVSLEAELKQNQMYLNNLSGDIASIQSFNPLLEDEWGHFEVKGKIATGEQLESSWELAFDDCPLIDNQMAHLVVSGDVNATLKDNVFFDGSLFVHKGRMNLGKDFFTDSASLDLNPRFQIHRTGAIRKEKADPLAWLTPIMNEMEGDIELDLGDRISIKAELPMAEEYGQSFASLSSVKVETDLRGKINAGWAIGEPQVTGTISTIRGSFETMGKSFDIDEGEIIFSGGQVYNPQLNLRAQKGFGGYGDIVVRVGGTVEEMKIDFESQNAPETYDQTDILSLILLGKPAREMADSESQTSSLLLTAGLKTMGGMVGGALGGGVVDEIDWDPSEDMFQIGKSLNDSMFLSYTKIREPDDGGNQNEITLEWLILNRVYMEFVTGDANNSQVTLYYRWIF